MKQLIITLVTVIGSIFGQAKANETETNPQAVAAFEKQFNSAKEVMWEEFGSVYKVSFQHNGLYATAYYDAEGSLVTVTRNVSLNDLPASLKSSAKKHLNNSWISQLVYSSGTEEKAYYVTFENTEKITIMKSVNNRKWIVYQVIEK